MLTKYEGDNMSKKVIDSFRGEYRWLSNFYLCDIEYDNKIYSSVENAYQAAKTYTLNRYKFLNCTPGQAKQLGREVLIRKDWENIKVSIMKELLDKKFKEGSDLANKLIETGDAELIEGNNWNDNFWGICSKDKGLNMLGRLLMKRRDILKELNHV